MKKVAIIGGDNKKGYEDKLRNCNYELVYHDVRMKRKGNKNYFSNLLKDVECVIVILSAISHGTMYAVKDAADKSKTKVVYHRSKVISSVVNAINENVVFY